MAKNDAHAELTPAQTRAIAALLAARNNREAAALAKVPERTLTRWLASDVFVAGLRQAEAALLDAATRRLLALQDGAIDTLQSLIKPRALVEEAVRLRAALGILSHVLKLRELRDLDARLSALEAAHNAQE